MERSIVRVLLRSIRGIEKNPSLLCNISREQEVFEKILAERDFFWPSEANEIIQTNSSTIRDFLRMPPDLQSLFAASKALHDFKLPHPSPILDSPEFEESKAIEIKDRPTLLFGHPLYNPTFILLFDISDDLVYGVQLGKSSKRTVGRSVLLWGESTVFGPRPFFEGYITRPKSFNDAHVPWAIHWFPLEGSIKLGREMYISQDVQGCGKFIQGREELSQYICFFKGSSVWSLEQLRFEIDRGWWRIINDDQQGHLTKHLLWRYQQREWIYENVSRTLGFPQTNAEEALQEEVKS